MPFADNRHSEDGVEALHLPRRRDLLRTLGVVGAVGLAGCSSQPDGGGQVPTASPSESGQGSTPTLEPLETSTPPPTQRGARREVSGRWISGSATDAESLLFIQTADAPSAARVGTALDGAYAVTTEEEVFPLWLDIESDDGQTYECTLRDGLEWGAGYGQMTAEDWVYMITEVFQAEDNWAGFAEQGEWRQNGQFVPVEQTGELTFEIQLPEVDLAFPLRPIVWGLFCLPKGLLEKYVPGKDVEGLQQDEEIQTLAYAGNLGPYQFERWDREAEFVATRNPDYYMHEAEDVPEAWRGAPYFEQMVLKVIPEESTRLAALRTGEITSTGIPPNRVTQFEELDSINVIQAPQPFNTLLIYNQRDNGWAPFRERGVRQALGWALDKRAIVDNILRGYARVAHTFQPRWSKWYDNSKVVQFGAGDRYNPQRSRALLAEALPSGYSYDGDTVVGPADDPVTLRMVYSIGSETTQTEAEFIAQAFRRVGLDVTLNSVPFNSMLRQYVQNSTPEGETPQWQSGPFNGGNRFESTSQQPWDLMYGIRFNTFPRTPTDTRGFWTTQGDINFYGYQPSVNMVKLYDTAASTTDEEERRTALAEIFGVLSEDQPCNFINFNVSISGYQDKVAGFGPIKFGFGWDSVTWFFEQG